ncbi:MAG TPA: alpha/beta hydrolase [Planctomycetota bacterium]|nr:alpha/beta hydrolase [Planctomycetota bacterium]
MMTKWASLLLLPLLAPDGVREVKDLAYVDGPDADPLKQKLDLYLPKGATKFPVLMWIHGGAWSFGDRAWYGDVGRRFAEEGIGAAIISYRLSPKVKHPAHVEDCARAFAWLREHVAEYGGDPERLFVSGQSAGGHLSALLACDPQYLRALKVPDGALKGAIPMSGVYTIPALPPQSKGLLGMFPVSFGSDPKVCRDASPSSHIAGLSVPMLVITETEDSAPLRFDARCLREAAQRGGAKDVTFIDAEKRNHFSIVTGLASRTPDPSRTAMMEFIRGRCKDLDR